MNKLKAIFLIFLLSSCTHTEPLSNSISLVEERQKVWKTLIKVMKAYPLKNIDKKAGYIETKIIKGPDIWKPPHKTDKDFYGHSYKIMAKLTYREPLSTVNIDKKVYKQKGFLAEKKMISSDHLEEQALLYEVAREIELKNLLDKMDL